MEGTIVAIIVAIIGAIGTIASALIISKRSNAFNKSVDDEKSVVSSRIIPIFTLGISLTTLAVIITIIIFTLSRVEKAIEPPPPLSNFLDTPLVPEIERLRKDDADAEAILMGAGPKELTIENRVRSKGDILYVSRWEWVDIVFPTSKRNDPTDNDRCGIQPGRKVTIIGFSLDRKSILFQYEDSGKTPGTSCDNETYFFYPYENEKNLKRGGRLDWRQHR